MSVNPLGVELLPETEQGEEICVICQDTLNKAPTYCLPECKHKFHTHCIVTWFRHRPSSNEHGSIADGRCPSCGNKGINNCTETKYRIGHGYHYSRRNSVGENYRYRVIMKESRKPNAPKELTRLVKKLNLSKQCCENSEQEMKTFKKLLKEKPMKYDEAQKHVRKLRGDIWRKRRIYESCKRAITWFPIVPIIIPTPIDIN